MRSLKTQARTEFALALGQIATERGIAPEVVLDSIKAAILAAYKKDAKETGELKEEWEYEVEIDPVTGESRVFGWEAEKPEDEEKKPPFAPTQSELRRGKKEVTPPGFGRIAAVTAKQVIRQKLREAEKSAILEEYGKRIGTLVSGMILRFDGVNIIVDIGRAEAVMPPSEQIKSEQYRANQKMTFYLEGIRESTKGRDIVVSRANPELVMGLFKSEVPEVSSGAVEIRGIAREPGSRSKVAVFSKQAGVDPVGSCVGQKGVRVQAVIEELNGEKIDIIQHSDEPEKMIAAALSPAENLSVKINEKNKSAVVTAAEDQLSLAIGREGQNVRLAAKLTGYRIDIEGPKTAEEVAEPVKEESKTKKAKKSPTKKATKKPSSKKATEGKEKIEEPTN